MIRGAPIVWQTSLCYPNEVLGVAALSVPYVPMSDTALLDAVRKPGIDVYANAGAACEDFRGTTLIERAGHWVQQEAADETNRALERFLDGV